MKYVLIEEVSLPDFIVPVPKDEWDEREVSIGGTTRSRPHRLNSGTVMVDFLTSSFERSRDSTGQPLTRQMPNDLARIRLVQKPLDYLDPDGDGKCNLPLGSYAELEDSWFELVKAQIDLYPWSITGRASLMALQGMLERMEKSSDVKPLTIDPEKPTENGAVKQIPAEVGV